jgi:hypothetical protein
MLDDRQTMNLINWLKKLRIKRLLAQDEPALFPNTRSCVRKDMTSRVPPQQMPPLMVRKAAWRK